MKATFFERVGAYFLDTIIVSLIFTVVCLGFANNTSNEELQLEDLDNQLLEEKITPNEYLKEYTEILYDVQKDTVLQTGISIALSAAYFIVFQYMNKGQTIGKKLLKIRVVDKDTKKPISILKGLLRSFIILSILSGVLGIVLLYIVNKENYFLSYATIISLEGIFTLITAMLVLYKKDRRGLHDMMANTIVIKESR